MNDYQSALLRLKKSETVEQLNKLENSFVLLYDLGFFNVREFSKLSVKIMEKIAVIVN